MLTAEDNERLTRVGKGTPAGEMLRRYWWPVSFTQALSPGDRRRVRLLNEDLVLFRDLQGGLGLLGLHCSHRRTSLEYGRVEKEGIRCCYHGWLYDHAGNCLEQPVEPEGSTFYKKIKHPAYKTQELGGLIFAYLGPEPAPLLPRYDILAVEPARHVVGGSIDYCNWLQRAENSVDQTHLGVLHASRLPEIAFKRPRIQWERTPWGGRIAFSFDGTNLHGVSHFIFPGHVRPNAGNTTLRFRVPSDDKTTLSFWVRTEPSESSELVTKEFEDRKPGEYTKDPNEKYWGVASGDQDSMAQESQGELCDRTEEHLSAADQGVIMLREMIVEAIEAVEQGRDPIGVIRDPAQDEIIMLDVGHWGALGQQPHGGAEPSSAV